MNSDDEILATVRQDRGLAELLREVCEFDPTRGDHGEPVRLSSGHPLEGIAGDFTGGTFFLCGEPRPIRPILYASSEGQAGLIGQSLAEALEIMLGLPATTPPHGCRPRFARDSINPGQWRDGCRVTPDRRVPRRDVQGMPTSPVRRSGAT